MTDCLVYFFTGFLDSGKTTAICSWVDSEGFRDKKVLILSTEEGEEEYNETTIPHTRPVVIQVETEEVTKEKMFALDKEYKPDVIFMEWNGSVSPAEFFEKVDVPRRWALAAAVVTVDATTYADYYRNMQPIFADYYRFCDTCIFNRVDPEIHNIPKLRGSVKSLNNGINLNFMDKNSQILDISDYLPYDLSLNPCNIEADDFGLFYTDALDNYKKYNGKVISLIGQAVVFREFKNKAFALQRQAYTCCADDIGQLNVLCFHEYGKNFPVGQWLKVTGEIRYFEEKQQDGTPIAVPCLQVKDYSITSAPENPMITFS